MQGDLLEDVRNQRILLDFILSLATLSACVAFIGAVAAPWIWLGPTIALAVASGGIACLIYRLALPAAVALSRALRAGRDLYRRDLLHVCPPNTDVTLSAIYKCHPRQLGLGGGRVRSPRRSAAPDRRPQYGGSKALRVFLPSGLAPLGS
jgi:hypothetical protein